MSTLQLEHPGYELHFESLDGTARGFALPCDARGQVDMDSLESAVLHHYLFARALIGKLFRLPAVRPRGKIFKI
ncbi:hypothetical protein [uncultured Azohydromonas sp.]|jgi:hypothetical protein|uniref:hypothetical protein n=1 Tax=uncultured Azohydromonas sp. TaxID=487342 RepID=UPI002624C761|nr:hypothetical protein [uncultured Azohydromonas sp.]